MIVERMGYMLKKDYVLTEILDRINEGKTVESIHEWLGLDEMVLMAIHDVHTTGTKWGRTLTDVDIVDFYRTGLTFSEVAWIKGVTKEAIRLTVDSAIGEGKKEAKKESKENRNVYRDIILYDMIVLESNVTSKEEAIRKTGYNKSVFNRMYRELVKWKLSMEEASKDN